MPIYEFECTQCKQVEQRIYTSFKRMVQEPAVRCLADNALMKRVPSAPAFTVSGFSYKNGYSGEKP